LGGLETIAHRGWHEVLAGCVMAFVAFVPFFAFKEMGRLLGEEEFRALFWTRRGGTPQ
jgi:type III secretory pathway component EscT